MRDPTEEPHSMHVPRLSRRTVLGGLVAAVTVPNVLTRSWAQAVPDQDAGNTGPSVTPALSATSPVARFQSAAAALNGGVLVTGGWRNTGLANYTPPLADTQIFTPGVNAWTEAAAMHTGRAEHAAVALDDGRVLVVGGRNHVPLASAEIYNPANNVWHQIAPMPEARYGLAAALVGGQVVVTGGYNQGPLATVLLYNIGTDTWQQAV